MVTNNAVNVGLSGSTGSGSFVGSTSATLTTPSFSGVTKPNLPYVRVVKTSAQAMPSGSFNALTWDAAISDPYSFWTVVANARLTVPAGLGGYYMVRGAAGPANTSTYVWATRLHKNGSGINLYGSAGQSNGSAQVPAVLTGGIINLAAGDYVEFYLYQDSGSDKNYGQDNYEGSFFELIWVSN